MTVYPTGSPMCWHPTRARAVVNASNTSSLLPMTPLFHRFFFCVFLFRYPPCTRTLSHPALFSPLQKSQVCVSATDSGEARKVSWKPSLSWRNILFTPASWVPLLRSCQDPRGVSHDPKTRRDRAYFLPKIWLIKKLFRKTLLKDKKEKGEGKEKKT